MNKKGFTLVELMIAMALVGIIGGFIYKIFFSTRDITSLKEKQNRFKNDFMTLTEILENDLKFNHSYITVNAAGEINEATTAIWINGSIFKFNSSSKVYEASIDKADTIMKFAMAVPTDEIKGISGTVAKCILYSYKEGSNYYLSYKRKVLKGDKIRNFNKKLYVPISKIYLKYKKGNEKNYLKLIFVSKVKNKKGKIFFKSTNEISVLVNADICF